MSFLFQPPGAESQVDFGAPALSKIKDQDDLVYIDMEDDFYWSQWNTGVSIGDPINPANTFAYQYQGDKYAVTVKNRSIYSMLDSGSTAIYFSELYFEDFIRTLFDYVGSDDFKMVDGIV